MPISVTGVLHRDRNTIDPPTNGVLIGGTNTGIAGIGVSRASLTPTAQTVYSTNGQTITGKLFTGNPGQFTGLVTLSGNNITLSGCQIEVTGYKAYGVQITGTGCVIQDCTITDGGSGFFVGIFVQGGTAIVQRVDVSDGENLVTIAAQSAIVQDSYLHGVNQLSDSTGHPDVMEIYDGSNHIIRRNKLLMWAEFVACVNLAPWSGAATCANTTIDDNYFDGGNSHILVDLQSTGTITNTRVRRNFMGGHTNTFVGQYSALLNIQNRTIASTEAGLTADPNGILWPVDSNANHWIDCADLVPNLAGQVVTVPGGASPSAVFGNASLSVSANRSAGGSGSGVTGGPPATGMTLWLRADDLPGANGSSVAAWSDVSGAGLPDFVQATGTAQPIIADSVANGHRGVVFNGTSHFLSASGTALDLFRNRSAAAVFVAYLYPTATGASRALVGFSSGTSTTQLRVGLYAEDVGTSVIGYRTLDADAGSGLTGATTVGRSGLHLLTGRYDFANTDLYVYDDGALSNTSTTYHTGTTTSNTSSLAGRIGSYSGGGDLFSGTILEILAYSVADTTTVNQVHAYLQSKYGNPAKTGDAALTVTANRSATGSVPSKIGNAPLAITASRSADGFITGSGVTNGSQVNATNTGIAGIGVSRASLTPTAGQTYSTNGQTITGKLFSGTVTLAGNNITLSGCQIEASGYAVNGVQVTGTGCVIQDCTITPTSPTTTAMYCAVLVSGGGTSATIRRCDIGWAENIVSVWVSGCLIDSSYLHDTSILSDPAGHLDIVEYYGGESLTISKSKLRMNTNQAYAVNIASFGSSCNNGVFDDNDIDGGEAHFIVDFQSGSGTINGTRMRRNVLGGHTVVGTFGRYTACYNQDGRAYVETTVAQAASPGSILWPTSGADANHWGPDCSDMSPDRTGQIVIP